MFEEATVDAYDDDEQATGWFTMLEEHLELPIETNMAASLSLSSPAPFVVDFFLAMRGSPCRSSSPQATFTASSFQPPSRLGCLTNHWCWKSLNISFPANPAFKLPTKTRDVDDDQGAAGRVVQAR